MLRLPQKTIINCTGFGARDLFGDKSVIPVRGQLAHVVPDPSVHYAMLYNQVSFLPRRDGWIFQALGDNDYFGYGDETTVPDRVEAEQAVKTIASLFAK